MNIKVSTLVSSLHVKEDFNSQNLSFISSIEDKLEDKLNIVDLDDYECDLKLIFIESGGSEGLFLQNIDKLKEPIYLLTSGNNNSLAASLEILTYMKLHNLNGEIIHGDLDYIVRRIKELSKPLISKPTRYGVIGKPSNWLISSIPDYQEVKDKFNIELIDISLDELINNYQEDDNHDYNFIFDRKEVNKANGVLTSLNEIITKYKLDGLTLRCFDLLNSIKTTGCLALAELNKKGIVATCEGDIAAMISMKIAQDVAKSSSFQANPSRIDTLNNEVIFAHCTVPFDMISDVKAMTHFESGIGLGIRGKLKEKDVTIFRLSSNLRDYYCVEGKILENLEDPNLCRTQVRVRLDDDVKKLLKNPCGNHIILIYGRYKEKIDSLL